MNIFESGPTALLKKLAEAHDSESGPDQRATVTVVLAQGGRYVGVPVFYSTAGGREHMTLANAKRQPAASIWLENVLAVETEDASAIASFLTRPWPIDERLLTPSKFQFNQELETLAKSLGVAVKASAECAELKPENLGTLLVWATRTKTILERLATEFPDALKRIQAIEVGISKQPISIERKGDTLKLASDLSKESFNRTELKAALSKAL